jgi:hypothetical protein
MITRPNKQLGVISTAGWKDASPYLWEKAQVGRALVNQDIRVGTAYFEWSAPEDADPAAVETWLACMPAMHRLDCPPKCKLHTVTIEAIRNEHAKALRSGKLSDFRRAYLNQWLPKPREGDETALGNWNACKLPTDAAPTETPHPLALGVATDVDREHASIGAVSMLEDGRPLLGAVDRREGTDWLTGELLRLQATYSCPVVIDAKGPAGDLIDDLRAAGVVVTEARLEDLIEACAKAYDRVQTGQLAHEGHPELDAAAQAARWRTVGDRRVFGRRSSTSDISMLEAVVLAMWHALDGYDVLDSVH